MQRRYAEAVAVCHGSQGAVGPAGRSRAGDRRGTQSFDVKVEGFSQPVRIQVVEELLGPLAVIGLGQLGKHVVGGNLKAVHDGDVPAAGLALVIADMVVMRVFRGASGPAPVGNPAVVGGQGLAQFLYVSIFYQGQKGSGLHHRTLLAPFGKHQVFTLPEHGLGCISAREVHHGADGSGLGFHDHADAGSHIRVFLDLGAEGTVGNVLEIHIYSGSDVIAILHRHNSGIQIPHPAVVVRHAAPFVALVSVELAVKTVFQALAGDILHIADGAAGQGVVGVDALLVGFYYDTASVGPLAEQREALHQFHRLQVHVFADGQVAVVVVASL